MNLGLFFFCAIAFISLSAICTIAESKTTEDLQNDSQLEEIQRKLQEMREWKDAISKEVETLKRVLSNKDATSSMKERRRRRSVNQMENRDAGAVLPPNGPSCTSGCPCSDGPRGYPGPAGPPGRDGRDAIALISTTGAHAGQATTLPSNTSGAVYVRWGHHDCPSTSRLLYSGSAAGTSWDDSGGGGNQLCLPQNPMYDSPVAGVGSERSFAYGVEYQIESFPEFQSKRWHDVPCAVCLAPTRFAKLIIPGTNICPSTGWTREYGGYLMAGRVHSLHKRSNHICVDREMQVIPRTDGVPPDGKRDTLNFVESRCSSSGGGIPCGPYVDGYELTCAVCTK